MALTLIAFSPPKSISILSLFEPPYPIISPLFKFSSSSCSSSSSLSLTSISSFTSSSSSSSLPIRFCSLHLRTSRRNLTSPPSAMLLPHNPLLSDVCAAVLSAGIALSLLRLWEETAKRQLCDQYLNRKLVHISIGLAFMLCWPMFSSGPRGAILASLTPGVNIIRMLLVGSGMWKDEATVKSMSRYGDQRELLKGPLYYAITITLACAVYWRTSPNAIAAICNLCAGDGMADVVGRRLGRQKLPYNRNKSVAGSIAMASAGFLASIGYMYYFASFGYLQCSWDLVFSFLVVSLASALAESLPISTQLDDNLTVTVTSILVGSLVF
ncbi:hypothetical protein Pint_32498 [Pistacia integerrima]|uniref:Uncharacterized protein n=1 Tax=Pistacia integerrima TaxID=434235 RepID=A0ACC0XSX0_9ROSI|nr:hypothetical protein Pint_32498 [Pistacia integerrima]